MSKQITADSFGRYADDVQESAGEYTLPIGDDYEIHPAATDGRWAVVHVTTGQVAAEFDDVDGAVEYARDHN